MEQERAEVWEKEVRFGFAVLGCNKRRRARVESLGLGAKRLSQASGRPRCLSALGPMRWVPLFLRFLCVLLFKFEIRFFAGLAALLLNSGVTPLIRTFSPSEGEGWVKAEIGGRKSEVREQRSEVGIGKQLSSNRRSVVLS